MKRVRTSLFFVAVLGVLALGGPAWGVEGMVSHWKFDEGQDSTAYDSAGNNDGVVYGATWTTGQIDGALSFDGINDYVDVGDPVDGSLDFGAADSFSISAWIKPIGNATIINKIRIPGGTFKEGYFIRIAYNQIQFYIEDTGGAGSSIIGNTTLEDGNWYHVVGVRDTAEDKLYVYVNGLSDTTPVTDTTITTLATTQEFWIGRMPYYNYFFNGKIDDVRVYNRALSAEEIQELYPGEFADLVGLEIVGPGEVAENFRASYKAIAYYDDDSTKDVTDSALWAVEPNTAANIDENGVLTTKDIVKHQSATILASYTEGDVTVEAEKAIDILAICPTGTALQFDGVDDYVDCGNDSSLNVGDGSYTLAAWIKTALSPLSPRGAILAKMKDGGSHQGYDIKINPDGTIWPHLISSWSSNAIRVHGSTAINDGNWHHVVVTYDGSNSASGFSIHIDGKPETLTITHDSLSGSTLTDASFTIGSRDGGEYLNSKIDEVSIYNRALSAEEIRANMHRRLTGDEPGLVGYWDFDEGEEQIVYDLSGNGNNGQLGSTPNADVSDPAWVDSDAPIGICTLYQIATKAAERALERKLALLEELLGTLAEEWTAYEALEELLESGDYGDLNKGDIVTAKQKIHSAIQHEEQAIDALEKSIEKLEDALSALGYEPEPPVPNQPPNVNITNPQDGAVFDSSETIEIEANAWDVDGSVVKVEFFANESKIGEDNDGIDGWKNHWYDPPAGTYSLTAKATDDDGAATTSPAVAVTVLEVPPPGQASNPDPVNGAAGVDFNANLSWTAGSNTVSHDVYFGTSSPPPFLHNQTAATFDPGTMAASTTYYWRIDEVNPSGTTTGTVWNFTTGSPPGQASNPNPADGATSVGINANLSWTAGSNAVSHNVYFGTASPGTFRGNQTATTFDPGTMAEGITYYWRIDEVNPGGTTTGTVWSFRTSSGPPPPP